MALRPWIAREKNLARVELVLATGGRTRDRLLRVAALVAGLLAGTSGSHVYWSEQLARWRQEAVPMNEFRQAEQALAQTSQQLHMSEAHGRELEHQIDGLNQRQRECLEEVTFFRKGRDAQR